MKEIIKKIHPYSITEPKDGSKDHRWYTYVKDKADPENKKKIRGKNLEDLYKKLLEYYDEEIQNQKKPNLTMGEFYQKWTRYKELFCKAQNKKKSLSPSTINRYRRDYKNFVAGTDLDKTLVNDVTSVLLEKELKEIIVKNNLKLSFSKNLLGYFREAFRYAFTSRMLSENIFDWVDTDLILSFADNDAVKKDSERILTVDQLGSLLDAVREHEKKHPYYMADYAIELAIYTGMRAGELAALKYVSINRETGYLEIDYSEHRIDYEDHSEYVIDEPKNLKHREFPLTDAILDLFDRINALGIESEFVFVRPNGSRYTGHDISCACMRRAKEAGLEKVCIHRIRRTVASLMRKYASINTISCLLGHTDKVDLENYQHDVADYNEKLEAANAVYENIIPFESRKPSKKRVGM